MVVCIPSLHTVVYSGQCKCSRKQHTGLHWNIWIDEWIYMNEDWPTALLSMYTEHTNWGCKIFINPLKSFKGTVVGFGTSHRNRWQRPFSTLEGISIILHAIIGWINPPMVRPVWFIVKFASPDTIYMRKKVCTMHVIVNLCGEWVLSHYMKYYVHAPLYIPLGDTFAGTDFHQVGT